MSGFGLRRVEVDGLLVDVRIDRGLVVEVGPDLRFGPDDQVVDGGGGALLPGLHDHHLHLLALAAARQSVRLGPPEVADHEGVAAVLQATDAALPAGAWIRAVGYHDSVAGPLDRRRLDDLVPRRPTRVQHRSGAMWVLNTAALRAVGADADGDGRLLGADEWLRDRLPEGGLPDLVAVGRELSGYGVTGVTDATPFSRSKDLDVLVDACARGDLPQHVQVTGGPALAAMDLSPGPSRGPVKILLSDHELPALDDLVAWMAGAHRLGRPVAVHCVTRVALVLALAAWDEAGARPGDRVEHGAVVDPELAHHVAALGVTVVTQPGFVAERGDRYLAEVDAADRPHLWPCRSLLDAGVAVAASTDAPFADADPWRAVAAATTRRTAGGRTLGAAEAVDPPTALSLLLGDLADPGGAPRRVRRGVAADLCLLDAPLDAVLRDPSSEHVVLTVQGGEVVHRRAAPATTPRRTVGLATKWALTPPAGVVERMEALGAPLSIDVVPLLGERTPATGAGRLLRAADGWLAVNLPREDDLAAVPAWLQVDDGGEPWAAVEAAVPSRTCAELVARATLLGLPVAALGEVAAPPEPVAAARVGEAEPLARPPLVVDLSALWAGPLCTRLLADRGAEVVKVESPTRPDGARRGPRAFFDRLNAGKRSVVCELDGPELADLLQQADVVVVAARARALARLGLTPERFAPKVWLSITGYGRSFDRVAFGDDAAVAGGLVAWDGDGPVFLADAVADPLTGVAAAAAADLALRSEGRWVVDAALAGVAAWVAAGAA